MWGCDDFSEPEPVTSCYRVSVWGSPSCPSPGAGREAPGNHCTTSNFIGESRLVDRDGPENRTKVETVETATGVYGDSQLKRGKDRRRSRGANIQPVCGFSPLAAPHPVCTKLSFCNRDKWREPPPYWSRSLPARDQRARKAKSGLLSASSAKIAAWGPRL